MNVNSDLIREMRLSKSWSQEALAENSGVSLRTVQRIEVDGVASYRSRIAIAKVLGLEPEELNMITKQESSAANLASHDVASPSESRSVMGYLGLILRYSIFAALWIGIITVVWLMFVILVSGVFYSDNSVTYWQNLGTNVIGASIFVPMAILLYWFTRMVTPRLLARNQ
ncbi:MAG: helix-turn-helix transcriptional regulator [Gammaproteobacteria bacterium]|nr:helix-turn-helix transcriptional regulator [Gammaproteobacteria bacterium]MDP2347143.1 helix-turn-helix transcriptional regulator [Gammaproteobacteria bacterium]